MTSEAKRQARAEDMYFAVYQHVALNAEYFQDTDIKRSLPELVVAAAAGAAFHAIFEGLFQGFVERFGEKAADYISDKIRDWKAGGKSPDQIIEAIAEAAPALIRPDVDWGVIEAKMVLEFTQQGMSLPISRKVASELCRIVREKSMA